MKKYYTLNAHMGFGKYRSHSLANVLVTDPNYIKWAIRESSVLSGAKFDEVTEALIGILMARGSVPKQMVAYQMVKLGYDDWPANQGITGELDKSDPVELAEALKAKVVSGIKQEKAEAVKVKIESQPMWGTW